MNGRIAWDITNYLAWRGLTLSIRIKRPVDLKQFVLGVSCENETAFINANPGWYRSESLSMPFKYLPPVEFAPQIVELPHINMPQSEKSAQIILQSWRAGDINPDDFFDVMLIDTQEASGSHRVYILEGVM